MEIVPLSITSMTQLSLSSKLQDPLVIRVDVFCKSSES